MITSTQPFFMCHSNYCQKSVPDVFNALVLEIRLNAPRQSTIPQKPFNSSAVVVVTGVSLKTLSLKTVSSWLYLLMFTWYVKSTLRWRMRLLFLALPAPCISESWIKIKINLNFYLHASLWCLKRFYESF